MYNQKHIKNNEHSTAFVDIDETICFYNDENRIYEQAIPSQINIDKILVVVVEMKILEQILL